VGETYTLKFSGFTKGQQVLFKLMGTTVGGLERLIGSPAEATGSGVFRWKIPEDITPGKYFFTASPLLTPNIMAATRIMDINAPAAASPKAQ
jgi:Na+/H+ antiporter NhaD/arsenite permease-like protein